ncbi:NADP-dependent oxidoreductase [Oceaniglobus trochenteri]|uniref:NADP-dependent oxidoreductase n=1 Tax=Oceaniglobus trochenteri TaxID=2763260 RepID=UPI001CFFC0D6|nr:NADP-dependent oxidoreductase [Oceaniglobus trochenteri]
MTDTVKAITLASRPKGAPATSDFATETVELKAPEAGQVRVQVLWLSLDPYMRGRMDDAKSYAAPVPLGGVMEGEAVGRIVASNAEGFAEGDIVIGPFGWSEGAVVDATHLRRVDPDRAPIQTALGVLGMPGLTAWVGLNDIAEAKAGETIVVSAATGAVGSVVGQLAKARGLRVIGVAGGAEKCAYAVEELGFDACIDHRAEDLAEQLKAAAPEVDIYFENVGGATLAAVLPLMAVGGRIALIGMIAWYNGKNLDQTIPLPAMWRAILTKRLKVQGMIVMDHADRREAFLDEVAPLVADGRVKYRETVAEGLDQAPEAFLAMLEGGNFGKQLVKVADA